MINIKMEVKFSLENGNLTKRCNQPYYLKVLEDCI